MLLSQTLRVLTDVTLYGEAKNVPPYSATSWCESKMSVLSGVTGPKNVRSHKKTVMMEEEVVHSVPQGPADPPCVFTSSG